MIRGGVSLRSPDQWIPDPQSFQETEAIQENEIEYPYSDLNEYPDYASHMLLCIGVVLDQHFACHCACVLIVPCVIDYKALLNRINKHALYLIVLYVCRCLIFGVFADLDQNTKIVPSN